MLKSLVQIIVFLMPVLLFAQNKDCKYEKFKDPTTGKAIQMITAPTKLGNFIVGKKEDSVVVFYSLKLLTAEVMRSGNTISLRLDSIMFVFDDNSLITIPISGVGRAVNKVVLYPQLEDTNFGFILSTANIAHFISKKAKAFRVYGEKESRTADVLTEKQSEKFSKAIVCFL